MQTLTRTAALEGPDPLIIDVESCTTSGFAGLQLVGNTSELLRDGKERAKTALEKLGFKLGHKRILVNLAPADLRKEGNQFDLPMALSIACLLSDKVPKNRPADFLCAAELSLDGKLRPIRAAVPLALAAMKNGLKGIVLAAANAPEIQAMSRIFDQGTGALEFRFFTTLQDVLQWVFEDQAAAPNETECEVSAVAKAQLDFDDMHLSPGMQRLALVCAVGQHSLLMRGTPGAGKSMFVTRLPSILPSMKPSEHFQALQTYSMHQNFVPRSILEGFPPFRHPHHSCSPQALLGTAYEPGDMSLAHGGILFLDELPEFRRDLLEALREPLESGYINISRAQKKCQWPAQVQFMAACNNCPCGWYGSSKHECRCPSKRLLAYWAKLSGPILDRIDIHFNMPEPVQPAVQLFHRSDQTPAGQTLMLRERVRQVLETMRERNENLGVRANAFIDTDQIQEALACSQKIFDGFIDRLLPRRLSNRAIIRCLRVARTLADLERRKEVQEGDILLAANWTPGMAARDRGESSGH